jgi:cell division protein FtsQ
VLAGVFLVVVGISWLVFFSPLLVVRNVTVQGTSTLVGDEVKDTADVPFGIPLARVNERAVGERVAALPAVDRVTVIRRWPITMNIRVTERRPLVHIGAGPEAVLVDPHGATFRATPPDGVLEGRGATDDTRLLAGVANVVEALPPELRDAAVLIEFPSSDAIMVQLAEDRRIFFGSAEHARTKGEVALALFHGTRADHIDVSAPSRPSTR